MGQARSIIVLGVVLLLVLAPAVEAGAGPEFPTLVAIRAAHHPGFDRIVFEFEGRLPESTSVRWAERITSDPSDLAVPVQGNAYLSVVMAHVRAHRDSPSWVTTYGPRQRGYDLPNITHLVAAGDFEAYVSFGIGLMKRTEILRTARLRDPSRYVIDVSTAFDKERVDVAFFDQDALDAGTPPALALVFVKRVVPPTAKPANALLRLWAGVTDEERANGLRFVSSYTRGVRNLEIERDTGIARIDLLGRCDDLGRPFSVADEVMATLRRFDRIDWVKIYRKGETRHPWGARDSVPDCLAP
jgi:hypothetical protein